MHGIFPQVWLAVSAIALDSTSVMVLADLAVRPAGTAAALQPPVAQRERLGRRAGKGKGAVVDPDGSGA